MTVQTEKEFYIETKHYVYVDYTILARDKEHALEQFENGSYDDINTDYGIYDDELTENVENDYLNSLSEGYDTKVDALVDSMGVSDKLVSQRHERRDLDAL